MNAVIQKWGNSQGIRLPKIILEELGMAENDRVEITAENDKLIVKKADKKVHKTVEERLTAFYGKPLSQIGELTYDGEIETGKPVGEEIW